ncbi:hypothetical protein K488DRAFT_71216 [Vararia minispora EC-137]|uniref:Uncharacterized protein n=1 Tax=Vararia minispora EC-137 TaxID=1314806 RepID=A0ACB8QIX6_9AGAM|nr:hypothetical protein K488DRAFT_71216 [Vararia minispora EC-137]
MTGSVYTRMKNTLDRLQSQLAASAPEEVQRVREENEALREENVILRAELEVTRRERDASVKQLKTMYQRVRQVVVETKEACIGINLSDNTVVDPAQSPSGSSTVRPTPLQPPFRSLSTSRPASRGPSEPNSTPSSSFRRTGMRLATPPSSQPHPSPKPSLINSSSTSGVTVLGAPFELRGEQSSNVPTSTRKFASLPRAHTRIKSGDYGSPMRVPITGSSSRATSVSLLASPGALSDMDGPSTHYDERMSTASVGGGSQSNAKWRIHFAKAPTTARATSDALPYERLAEILQFDEETELSVKRLADQDPDRMRLYIADRFGFVYDPVVLEAPESTYFVDWGLEEENYKVEQFIRTKTVNYDGLHTFLFTTRKNAWLYIGHRKWTVSNALKEVWPLLGQTAQRTLAGRRASGHMDAADFALRVQDKKFKQIGIELSSLEDESEEADLLRRL